LLLIDAAAHVTLLEEFTYIGSLIKTQITHLLHPLLAENNLHGCTSNFCMTERAMAVRLPVRQIQQSAC